MLQTIIPDEYRVADGMTCISDSPLQDTCSYLHYHPVIEIGLVREGTGVFYLGNRVLALTEGCVTVAFPGEIHIGKSTGETPCRFDYILIDADLAFPRIPYLHTLLSAPYCGGVFSEPEITDTAQRLIISLKEADTPKEFLSELLAAELIRRITKISDSAPDRQAPPEILLPALNHIAANYARPIVCKELASLVYLSEPQFRRVFKNALGISPMDYLYRTRIAVAESLLQSRKKSVLEIAAEVGYPSPSSFYRHFRLYTGHSPKHK